MSEREREMNRRRLLVRGLGTAGAFLLPSSCASSAEREEVEPVPPTEPDPAVRAEAPPPEPVTNVEDKRPLVLVQLTGGNDGLSTVVPHGDDAYHAARDFTRIPGDEVLRIDDYRGFHPRLKRLHARYQEGGLAIVEGVGYPNPSRSHFKSLEIWHTADEAGRIAGEGWIGRLCEASFGPEADPNRVVHLGHTMPYSVVSSAHPAAAFASPAGYRFVENADGLTRFAGADAAPPTAALGFLRRRLGDASASSATIREAVARYRTPVEYPRHEFATSLRYAAALIHADVGTRVLSVEIKGFDTHVDQLRRHRNLMALLDDSLAPFLDDLERSAIGREAIVLIFSEFGRRVAENGSRGTDHGCAGPMFVAGHRVNGGLFGRHPSLTDLDDGDLYYTTDFRSVYSEAIEACFDVHPRRVLGRGFPRLDLIAS